MADETLNTRPPIDLPPPPPRPEPADTAPSRPTTRAGRAAAAAAKRAERDANKAKGKADATPKLAKPTPRRASLETRLAGSLASIGTGILVSGVAAGSEAVQADGLLVVEHSPHIAAALDKLAKDNPAVAASLERMLTAGAWSGVIAAMMPVALGVAANHGLLPKGLLEQLGAGQAEPEPAPGG